MFTITMFFYHVFNGNRLLTSRGDLEGGHDVRQITTKMAAGEEVTLLQCATERCSLLIQLNTTIETLLARGNEHEWHAFGGLSRVVEDLAHIFTHGLRDQQV